MRYAENAKTEWESAEERRERLKQVASLSFYRSTSLIRNRHPFAHEKMPPPPSTTVGP